MDRSSHVASYTLFGLLILLPGCCRTTKTDTDQRPQQAVKDLNAFPANSACKLSVSRTSHIALAGLGCPVELRTYPDCRRVAQSAQDYSADALAWSSQCKSVLLLDFSNMNLHILDGKRLTLTKSLQLPFRPGGMSLDESSGLLLIWEGAHYSNVALVDTQSWKIIRLVTAPIKIALRGGVLHSNADITLLSPTGEVCHLRAPDYVAHTASPLPSFLYERLLFSHSLSTFVACEMDGPHYVTFSMSHQDITVASVAASISDVCFDPTGSRLYIACFDIRNKVPSTLHVEEFSTRRTRRFSFSNDARCFSIAFADDRKEFFYLSEDGQAHMASLD